jgi:integrase
MAKRANSEGSIYQRKDGRWCASVCVREDNRVKRKYFYATTQAEAMSKRDAARTAQRKGLPLPDERETVGRWLRHWLEHYIEPSVRPRTMRSYKGLVEDHIIPELGHKGLTQLSVDDVQRFVTRKRGRGLSPRTVRYLLVVLRMALKKAEALGKVARNVATLAAGPRIERKEVQPLTVEQTRSFLGALEGERFGALFLVAATRGLRLGEALALRWSDLDLDDEVPTLRVAHTLQREGRGPERCWHLAPPKSAKSVRSLHLSPTVIDSLRAHRTRQIEERLLAGTSWENHDLVFATRLGRPLEERNVRRAFYRVIDRAGLPRKRLHDLRHGHATQLLLAGENMRQVSAALGHSQIGVTMDTYAHVVTALDERASDKLESLLFDQRSESALLSKPAVKSATKSRAA